MLKDEHDLKHLHWPDHISSRALEKMILCLVENEGDENCRLHYRVCVYTKAFFCALKWSQVYRSPTIRQRLEISQRQYKAIVLAGLFRLHFLLPPSISLVQALLSGVSHHSIHGKWTKTLISQAMLMQYIGNMSRSWSLAAFAARILVSLNSHTVEGRQLLRSDLNEDSDSCLYWCYYLDKVLSALFARQPSLPRLDFDPTSLITGDSSNPLQKTVRIMVEMAKVQEGILDMQLSRAEKRVDEEPRIDCLIRSAQCLFDQMKEVSARFLGQRVIY